MHSVDPTHSPLATGIILGFLIGNIVGWIQGFLVALTVGRFGKTGKENKP